MFGSLSAGLEQDSGTLYPTLMEDTNGNQITIAYNGAIGIGGGNSSSRIQSIQDLRGSYNFTYDNSLVVPRLSSITNTMGTAEKYSLTYTGSAALLSPWNQSNFGTISLLWSLKQTGTNLTTNFLYDTSGAPPAIPSGGPYDGTGELTQVTTPYGGHLRWTYQANSYVGTRTFREVQSRYLLQSSGGSETGVSIYHDSGDPNRSMHLYANFFDWSGGSNKVWWFQTDPSQFNAGMVTGYEERNYPSGVPLFHQDFTWAQSSISPPPETPGNPYISSTLTKLDPNQSYQAQKKTSQTVDQYGNLTDMLVYDFGNLSTPVRTYHNNYLTGSNYSSRYIFNRLTQSTVTDGPHTTTLSQITYDGGLNYTDPSTQQNPMGNHDAAYGTTFLYRGVPTSIVTPARTVTNQYDIGGNVTSSTTNGVTTTSTTESGSDYAVPKTMTTTGSLLNTMNYNSTLEPTSAIGPNGETASIAYDGNARPGTTTSPFGAQNTFTYNDTQSPPVIIAVTSSSNTNPHWARATKDGFGRTIKSETGSGSTPGTALSVVDTVYAPCGCSPLGKLWKTSLPHAPGATQYWTVYTYDGSGRTLSVTSPDGASHTSYVYQGNKVTVTDPANNSKTFIMDAMGNLTKVLETDPTLGQVSTSYTYDMLNHLTQVSMPRGPQIPPTIQTRTFNYTSGATVGAHLLSATNPENGTVTYTYNSDHTLAGKTDAKGAQAGYSFTYTYDAYKRLLTVSVNGNVLRTYSYDTNPYDSSYSQYSAGRLTAIQYPAINYDVYAGSPQGSTTFTDMFSYWPQGAIAGKRLRVTKVAPYPNGLPHTQTAVGDLNMAYARAR